MRRHVLAFLKDIIVVNTNVLPGALYSDDSPYVRQSKTVLNSGFHATDSGFHLLDSRFFVSGVGIPDFCSCNPDSKAGFHK